MKGKTHMSSNENIRKVKVAGWSLLQDRIPAYALIKNVDLVVVRYDDTVSVLYGRCLHRGALLSDGHVEGHNLICGLHGWDYRLDSGISEYDNEERLQKFSVWIDEKGDYHREGGPAIEYRDGTKEWLINGKTHRTDGPAVEWYDGSNYWYLNDELMSEKKYNEKVKSYA